MIFSFLYNYFFSSEDTSTIENESKNENDVDDFLTKSCVIEKTLTPYHTCPLPKNKVLPNI